MGVYLAVFFWLTLVAYHHPGAPMNLVPFRTIRHDIRVGGDEFAVNILGNLAAGFPMGVLLPGVMRRRCAWAWVAGIGLAVSLLIESLQGLSGCRVADVDDLILNTSGGLMGYGCRLAVEWFPGWWSRGRRQA